MTQPLRQDELTTAELLGARRRFAAKIRIDDVDHWIWTASKDAAGHGWFRLAKRYNPTNAHRVAWLLWRGDLDPSKVVVPCPAGCVHPHHLREEPLAVWRNRSVRAAQDAWRGAVSPHRKLSDADVRRALRMLRFGWLQRQVAAKLGVSMALIGFIATGRHRWAVTGLPRRPMVRVP
jgi:hypothetical protein